LVVGTKYVTDYHLSAHFIYTFCIYPYQWKLANGELKVVFWVE